MPGNTKAVYQLDQQVGFLLRKALQRNSELFSGLMFPELTPTRFAAMARLFEMGALSQNELGRQTAMDVATIKGVVERLVKLELVTASKDPDDGRKHLLELTTKGKRIFAKSVEPAIEVSARSLEGLNRSESKTLVYLLKKIG